VLKDPDSYCTGTQKFMLSVAFVFLTLIVLPDVSAYQVCVCMYVCAFALPHRFGFFLIFVVALFHERFPVLILFFFFILMSSSSLWWQSFFYLFILMLGMEPRVSPLLGICSVTELHPTSPVCSSSPCLCMFTVRPICSSRLHHQGLELCVLP
jgi:hypothetical protein